MLTPLSGDILLRFLLAALATWRVTHLLANEDGPGDVVFHLRRSLGASWIGGLMDCFACLSFWVAVPAALFVTAQPVTWAVTWLALSGAACLLQRTGERDVPDPLAPTEDEGDDHVLR
jgi:hypothetical protein